MQPSLQCWHIASGRRHICKHDNPVPGATNKVSNSLDIGPYPGLRNALMLVAPDDKVKEACQVAFTDAVLCVLGVGHSVLVQHKHVEPV